MESNRYSAIIESIFLSKYTSGMEEVNFERDDLVKVSENLGLELPRNLGDIIYSFRYRTPLPIGISKTAGEGKEWIIRPAGRSKYKFALVPYQRLEPNPHIAITKIPDSTPGIVKKYTLSDEQALLAIVRYNRLIDIFTGIPCYSLQNHLRTTATDIGQVETDEIYVGVDKKGIHYVIPVQAKSGSDKLSIVQIEQDIAVCREKFPSLINRPIGAQFSDNDVIVLFEFVETDEGLKITAEKHYKLVPPDEIKETDLESYRRRLSD